MRLLFIGPRNKPAEHPLIDELTMKMTAALRKGTEPELKVTGVGICVCGAMGSGLMGVILPNGWVTSTLSVHYLAYHRDEVPASDLEAVQTLAFGSEVPSGNALGDPEFRSVREHLLVDRVHDLGEELGSDMMSWTYELSLENRANVDAILSHASVMLSLGAVYTSAEILEIGRVLAPGEMWRVQRTAVFQLSEFRRDRSPAIAALVTPNSPKGATWEFWGDWADGTELYLLTEARRRRR